MEKKIGATLADLVREQVTKEVTERVTERVTEQVTERVLLRTRRNVLRELLEERFGVLPADLLQRIENCADINRLQAAARQILRLEKLDDFRLEA